MPTSEITALLLAGRRPDVDPLASHAGVANKALIPVNGEPMLSRVARALVTHPAIERVIVLAQDGVGLAGDPGTRWLADDPRITFESGGDSVSATIAEAIGRHRDGFPFLVATADDALIDHAKIDAFLVGARGADIAAALVERRTLLAAYPASRRTWLKFRGGAYSGANLFWLASERVSAVLALWRTIEQDRKRGRAIIAAFGPLLLLGVGLRLLTLDQAMRLAGRRFGLVARAVALPMAEACIDVDKPDDLALASEILSARDA